MMKTSGAQRLIIQLNYLEKKYSHNVTTSITQSEEILNVNNYLITAKEMVLHGHNCMVQGGLNLEVPSDTLAGSSSHAAHQGAAEYKLHWVLLKPGTFTGSNLLEGGGGGGGRGRVERGGGHFQDTCTPQITG